VMAKAVHTATIRVYHSGEGYKDHTVEVTVDWDELSKHLGQRAVRNKHGRSRLAAGVSVKEIR